MLGLLFVICRCVNILILSGHFTPACTPMNIIPHYHILANYMAAPFAAHTDLMNFAKFSCFISMHSSVESDMNLKRLSHVKVLFMLMIV